MMCDNCLLIRGEPAQSFKSNIHTYHRFQDYFPELDLTSISKSQAIAELLLRYLKAFGPVTIDDITWWTGLTKTSIQDALKEICQRLINLQIDGLSGIYYMLRSDRTLMKKIKPAPQPTVNLLPRLDPYIMGYKVRDRYLHPGFYHQVFDRSGNAASSILVDGRIVGVWDYQEKPQPLVKIYLFEKEPQNLKKLIFSQAQKTGRFLAGKPVEIKSCPAMTPLNKRPAGGFMTPLKDS